MITQHSWVYAILLWWLHKQKPLRGTFLVGMAIQVPKWLSTKFLNHRNFKDPRNFIYSFQTSFQNVSLTTRLNSVAKVL